MTKAPAKKIRPVRFKKNTAIQPRAVGVSGHTAENMKEAWQLYQAKLKRSSVRDNSIDVSESEFQAIFKIIRKSVRRDADRGAGLRLMRLDEPAELESAEDAVAAIAEFNAIILAMNNKSNAILAQMIASGAYRERRARGLSQIYPGIITKHLRRHIELFSDIELTTKAFVGTNARHGPRSNPKIQRTCAKLAKIWLNGLGASVTTLHSGHMMKFFKTVLPFFNIIYQPKKRYMLFKNGKYQQKAWMTENVGPEFAVRHGAILDGLPAALKRERKSRGDFQT